MLFISLCGAKMRCNAKKGVNIAICSAIKMEIKESVMVCSAIHNLVKLVVLFDAADSDMTVQRW